MGEHCGMCVRGSDVGVYVDNDPIAYVHPGCPEHGSCEEFVPGGPRDGADREMCADCRAYEDEHKYKAH